MRWLMKSVHKKLWRFKLTENHSEWHGWAIEIWKNIFSSQFAENGGLKDEVELMFDLHWF